MPPKAIFFDFDETLAENVIPIQDLFAEMYFQFSDQIGVENQEPFFAALRSNAGLLWNRMFDTQETPESQFTNCFKSSIDVLQRFNQQQSSRLAGEMFNRFLELSSVNVKLHDGAEETIEVLNNSGFITGIITNGIESLQLGKIHGLDLHNKVHHVVVSAQARAHKPHARVFELALERANVAANQAWQIGDHPTNDVAGAIRAGMSGIFYDPGKDRLASAFNELAEAPTHTIHNLTEILDLLELTR